MSKWTCTVIQNAASGKYHADMLINNKSVDGIPFDVDYKTLSDAIKRVTGISILKRKEMIFERLSDFERIATLDNTQCRKDCRVTVEERINGWMPCWDEEDFTMTYAKEFRERVKTKLIQANSEIKAEDLYFSQTAKLYCLSYKPKYPEKSNGDFTVYQDILNGVVSMQEDNAALIPTIRSFDSLADFENQL